MLDKELKLQDDLQPTETVLPTTADRGKEGGSGRGGGGEADAARRHADTPSPSVGVGAGEGEGEGAGEDFAARRRRLHLLQVECALAEIQSELEELAGSRRAAERQEEDHRHLEDAVVVAAGGGGGAGTGLHAGGHDARSLATDILFEVQGAAERHRQRQDAWYRLDGNSERAAMELWELRALARGKFRSWLDSSSSTAMNLDRMLREKTPLRDAAWERMAELKREVDEMCSEEEEEKEEEEGRRKRRNVFRRKGTTNEDY